MKKVSATIARNKIRVGKNSKSYDAKHPENLVLYGVVSAAKKKAVKFDAKGFPYPDAEQLQFLKWVGERSKPEINALLA